MRAERTFHNGRTGQPEVHLERVFRKPDNREAGCQWRVEGAGLATKRYPDTEKGYAAALADYEARVERRMREG